MIKKTSKLHQVVSKIDKFCVKGDDKVYSEATEFKDKPREYEEIK